MQVVGVSTVCVESVIASALGEEVGLHSQGKFIPPLGKSQDRKSLDVFRPCTL